jgi:hypothetical protein
MDIADHGKTMHGFVQQASCSFYATDRLGHDVRTKS